MTGWESIAIIMGTSGGLTGLIELFKWWYMNRSGTKIDSAIANINKIYSILNSLLHETVANRISVFRISNGGSIPRPGVTLYMSTVYEVVSPPCVPNKDQWDKRIIDEELLYHIFQVAQKNHVSITIDQLNQESVLYNNLKSHGIDTIDLYLAYKEDGCIYIVGLEYLTKPTYDAKTKDLLSHSISQFNKLFKS